MIKKTIAKEYNINLSDGLDWVKTIFHEANPQERYHITEYDLEYCDGHHEVETEKQKLGIKTEKVLRTENKTTYGYMKFTDYYYTEYEVEYIDGTKGKRYSTRVESD